MAIRTIKEVVVKDTRKFFVFPRKDGGFAETKAMTREEAKEYIERTLGEKLKEVV